MVPQEHIGWMIEQPDDILSVRKTQVPVFSLLTLSSFPQLQTYVAPQELFRNLIQSLRLCSSHEKDYTDSRTALGW